MGSVAVTVAGAGCAAWSVATPPVSWVHVAGGSGSASSGTVSYSVDSNTTASIRTTTLTIANQSYTVQQNAAPCTYALSSATSGTLAAGGASGSLSRDCGRAGLHLDDHPALRRQLAMDSRDFGAERHELGRRELHGGSQQHDLGAQPGADLERQEPGHHPHLHGQPGRGGGQHRAAADREPERYCKRGQLYLRQSAGGFHRAGVLLFDLRQRAGTGQSRAEAPPVIRWARTWAA